MKNLEHLKKQLVNYADPINTVCAPFFKRYNISYFSYGRFNDDGTINLLLTNPSWFEHFLTKKYPVAIPNTNDFINNQSLVYLWDDALYSEAVNDAKTLFKMNHGITLMSRCSGYFEYFTFASAENSKIISFYLNNLSILESFGQYFLDKASDIIRETHKNRPVLNKEKTQLIMLPTIDNFDDGFSLDTPLEQKKIRRIEFTPRELDCLQMLRQGFTAKEIGLQLHLSPRTVYDYLEKIKDKIGCKRKSQIISTLEKTVKSTVGKIG